MNKSQKIAVFLVVCIILQITLCVVARLNPSFNFGLKPPTTGVVLCVLTVCIVFSTFYRTLWPLRGGSGKHKIVLDERDRLFIRRAEYIGFTASYAFFVLLCLGCWLFAKEDGMIKAAILLEIAVGGYYVYEFVRSCSLLAFYRWGVDDGQD